MSTPTLEAKALYQKNINGVKEYVSTLRNYAEDSGHATPIKRARGRAQSSKPAVEESSALDGEEQLVDHHDQLAFYNLLQK